MVRLVAMRGASDAGLAQGAADSPLTFSLDRSSLPVESGFFIVLATNILFPALIYGAQAGLSGPGPAWDWTAAGVFATGGTIYEACAACHRKYAADSPKAQQ